MALKLQENRKFLQDGHIYGHCVDIGKFRLLQVYGADERIAVCEKVEKGHNRVSMVKNSNIVEYPINELIR